MFSNIKSKSVCKKIISVVKSSFVKTNVINIYMIKVIHIYFYKKNIENPRTQKKFFILNKHVWIIIIYNTGGIIYIQKQKYIRH